MKYCAEKCPELIPEWSEKNNFSIWDVSYGSNRKAWWKCACCGNEWEGIIKNRCNGHGCPYCSGNKVLRGFNDLKTLYPEVAAEWSDRNGILLPVTVTAKSPRSVWWKCRKCGYEWKSRIADRTDGHGCPVCAGEIVVKGINDLATHYPALAEEWSTENDRPATEFSVKSVNNVRWHCIECGYKWNAVIATRVRGQKCPACLRRERERQKAIETADKTEVMASYIRRLSERYDLRIKEHSDKEVGIPLRLYFPDINAAVEISGKEARQGPERRLEDAKNWLCFNAGIRMIRILSPDVRPFDNCFCIKRKDNSLKEAVEAVKKVMRILAGL